MSFEELRHVIVNLQTQQRKFNLSELFIVHRLSTKSDVSSISFISLEAVISDHMLSLSSMLQVGDSAVY